MVPAQEKKDAPPYSRVHEIFVRNCVKCHNAEKNEGDLELDKYETLIKGTDEGPVIKPGRAEESLLVRSIEHRRKPEMPPPKKGEKLKPEEIALVRAWIDAGAAGPKPGEVLSVPLLIPKIAPKVAPRQAVHAVAYEPRAKLLALGKPGEVELRSAESRAVVRRLAGHAGNVNDLAFSADGAVLAAASGRTGIGGEVRLWSVADGKLLRAIEGHKDAIYSVAISPDGKILATGSYDTKIILWDAATGAQKLVLSGHNEAVFDVAFRKDGKVLASASADRTVKLWDVATGERRDTLTESTKALHAVAFSPDGSELAAAGVDNRIRVWKVSPDAKEGTNPLRGSQFAHEGSILALRYSGDGKTILSSADDRSVKLTNAADLAARLVIEAQPDWPSALSFALEDKAVVVGRLDGTLAFYDAATGKPLAAPRPEGSGLEPRGVQRGTTAKVKVNGKNLATVTGAKSNSPLLKVEPADGDAFRADAAWVDITPSGDLAPGVYEITLTGPGGDAAPLKIHVDDLPQAVEREPNDAPAAATELTLPTSVWGALGKGGDFDHFSFEGKKGRTIVLDAGAKRFGAKTELVLTLSDASGRVLASNIDFEGDADPALFHALPADGRYVVRVSDLGLGASADHFYRLSIGELPLVTGVWPLGVPANAESEVFLAGPNLPAGASVRVKAGAPGEAVVPIDPARFRARREFKVIVGAGAEAVEVEPNDRPDEAQKIAVPGAASGRIGREGDADLYRFEAKRGATWLIETQAAQRGSPVDTKIEILHPDGKPVPRLLLRAVRDSWLTFRPIDANSGGCRLPNWEEMELNQYLYIRGEVARLFLAPRGPDSEWGFFTLSGKRKGYFDTSATSHPLDTACYIVEPHPPGTQLPANGLPVFELPFANDDDADRRLGSDSRLFFTPPADGAYLARVTDVRGGGGDRHAYRLSLREAKPDFNAFLEGQNASVPMGSGRGFTIRLDRVDGFDGAVRVDLAGLPPGYAATTPVIVEAGHMEAKGSLWAAADAPKPTKDGVKLVGTAVIGGREVRKDVNAFGLLALAAKPMVSVSLAALDGKEEVALVPGQEVQAILKIERNGFNDRVTFDVENLPHGVIVGDIGLSGILIPEKQTERVIFLQCAGWVAPQDRPCHARAREVGNPTSRPVTLRILPKP